MSSLHDDTVSSIFMTPFSSVILFLLLFISFIYNIYELTVFCFILITAGFFSYIWSLLSIRKIGLSLKCSKSDFFSGDKKIITLDVVNSKPLPVLFRVEVLMENLVLKPVNQRQASAEQILFPFRRYSIPLEFSPSSRGVYRIQPPEIRGGDIFGFSFRNKKISRDPIEITVYPAVRETGIPPFLFSDYSGTHKGRGAVPDRLLIQGVRDYQNGSSIRNIHWKSSAKYSRLQEKVFDPSEKEKILIIFDVNNYGKNSLLFEAALETAASLVLMPEMRKKSLGMLTNGEVFNNRSGFVPASGNSRQEMCILEILSGIIPAEGEDISRLLERGAFLSSGLSCIYFAFSISDDIYKTNRVLRKRKIPVTYIVSEKGDSALGNMKYSLVRDLTPGKDTA